MPEIARGELGAHTSEEVDELRVAEPPLDLDLAKAEDARPAIEGLRFDAAVAFLAFLAPLLVAFARGGGGRALFGLRRLRRRGRVCLGLRRAMVLSPALLRLRQAGRRREGEKRD